MLPGLTVYTAVVPVPHARAELRHLNDVVVHGSADLASGAHKFDGAVACVGKRAHRERHGGAVFEQEAGHLMIHHIVVVVETPLAVGAFLQRLFARLIALVRPQGRQRGGPGVLSSRYSAGA